MRWLFFAFSGFLFIECSEEIFHFCDESCGPQVSKCMLLQACNCVINTPRNNCSCCKNCTQCLGNMYADCCACVGLCKTSSGSVLSWNSEVEDFELPLDTENIFEERIAFMPGANWASYSFPVSEEIRKKDATSQSLPELLLSDSSEIANCTVIFFNQCISADDCKRRCKVSSAAKMRWFHTGCCECVSENCINYGLGDPRCANCKSGKL